MVIDNVQQPFSVERALINGSVSNALLPFITDSIKRLNRAGVDFIAIPCNTAHIFIRQVRLLSKAPVLSIVEETTRILKKRKIQKAGLLATSATVNSGVYTKDLSKQGIGLVLPVRDEQTKISRIVLKILEGKVTQEDRCTLISIAETMLASGAEVILLACTDLQSVIMKEDLEGKSIDTLEILIDAAFSCMTKC